MAQPYLRRVDIAEKEKPVIISGVIALPLAGWVMSQWLPGFAYRISMSWWVFAAAAFTALLVALLTVSF